MTFPARFTSPESPRSGDIYVAQRVSAEDKANLKSDQPRSGDIVERGLGICRRSAPLLVERDHSPALTRWATEISRRSAATSVERGRAGQSIKRPYSAVPFSQAQRQHCARLGMTNLLWSTHV